MLRFAHFGGCKLVFHLFVVHVRVGLCGRQRVMRQPCMKDLVEAIAARMHL